MDSPVSSKGPAWLVLPGAVCPSPDLSSLTVYFHVVWPACLAEGGQPCPLEVLMPFKQVLSET